MTKTRLYVAASAALLCLGAGAQAQQANMTFFVTSAGPGKGADLGGIAGADKHCQTLATAAGAGTHTWHAYLSTSAAGGTPAVNARDRIGSGPWQNAKGEVIAKSVDELHVNGRGDTPNMHDAITGSKPDGTAFPAEPDMTCKNYTSSTAGATMLGHIDRQGLRDDAESKSWNSSHPSRGPGGGCAQDDLKSTGGAGLFYCFAVR
jgi:hypothetical protein